MKTSDFREVLIDMLLAASDSMHTAHTQEDGAREVRYRSERDLLFRLLAILDGGPED